MSWGVTSIGTRALDALPSTRIRLANSNLIQGSKYDCSFHHNHRISPFAARTVLCYEYKHVCTDYRFASTCKPLCLASEASSEAPRRAKRRIPGQLVCDGRHRPRIRSHTHVHTHSHTPTLALSLSLSRANPPTKTGGRFRSLHFGCSFVTPFFFFLFAPINS